jgi:hypothetical protein
MNDPLRQAGNGSLRLDRRTNAAPELKVPVDGKAVRAKCHGAGGGGCREAVN